MNTLIVMHTEYVNTDAHYHWYAEMYESAVQAVAEARSTYQSSGLGCLVEDSGGKTLAIIDVHGEWISESVKENEI